MNNKKPFYDDDRLENKLYDANKDNIKAQAFEIQFCLENDYSDSLKSILPWMRRMWKKSDKDWFKRYYDNK